MNKKEIEGLRKKLLEKRKDFLNSIQRKKESDLPTVEVGDEADVATNSLEKEFFFGVSDSERRNLDDIEAALRKIEKNKYGLCESCGKKISVERLKVIPWARYCINCQGEKESPSL